MPKTPYYPRVFIKFRPFGNNADNLRDFLLKECRKCKVPRADLKTFEEETKDLDYEALVKWAEERFTTSQ